MENLSNITPESVQVDPSQAGQHPHMASFFDRLIAVIIDGLILSAVNWTFSILFGLNMSFTSGSSLTSSHSYTNGASGMLSILIFGAYIAYFYSQKGQTVGKMLMKIKVVRASDLKYLTPGEALLRDLVGKFVSGLLFDLGYFWYFMNEKRQTWHDSIAKTYVVKTDEHGNLLMDGQASYKKEPVKTFLPCGCTGIAMALFIGGLVYAVMHLGSGVKDAMKKQQDAQSQLEQMKTMPDAKGGMQVPPMYKDTTNPGTTTPGDGTMMQPTDVPAPDGFEPNKTTTSKGYEITVNGKKYTMDENGKLVPVK